MSGSGDTGGSSSDLEHELKRTIQGEVRFDRGSRALYASDASNYRPVPVGLAGKTVDNVDQLHILLYDGTEMTVGATSPGDLSSFLGEPGRKREIYSKLLTLRDRYGDLVRARYPRIPRRVSGYNLDQLLPEH